MTYDALEKSVYGGKPIELFSFICGAYRLLVTNAEIVQTFLGATYETGWSITRNEPETSEETSHSDLEIYVAQDFPIASMFALNTVWQPIWLTVIRKHRDDSGYVTLWAGKVIDCSINPSKRSATLICKPVEALSKIGFQQTCSPQCTRRLYSPRCGVSEAAHLVVTTLDSVSADGLTITATAFASKPNDYFKLGDLYIPALGAHMKILSHVGITLTLLRPVTGLLPGETVQALAGCDHVWKKGNGDWGDCHLKFNNAINAMMWPFVPIKNPYSVGLEG